MSFLLGCSAAKLLVGAKSMFESSVIFAFRDKITQAIASFAAKALRSEINYGDCCAIPKLTEHLGIAPVKMNSELQTLVARGYVTIQNECVFPTWKALRGHPDFKGISVQQATDIIARLRTPARSAAEGSAERR
jgi:hypothetical protein